MMQTIALSLLGRVEIKICSRYHAGHGAELYLKLRTTAVLKLNGPLRSTSVPNPSKIWHSICLNATGVSPGTQPAARHRKDFCGAFSCFTSPGAWRR